MKILSFIIIFIFAAGWGYFTKIFLPKDINDGISKKYDERQTKILLEVFSNTLVWLIYAFLLSILLKLVGISNIEKMWFFHYPEIFYIILAIVLFLFNLIYTKKKYSAEG
ncbi:hypothetical protein [Macrococcus brunensis]|uniref:hypothetical protein n=1 Tax=Macrococcus brunensis TaxID=198483 RepID=UPI001EF0B306|nr:hypothetical protein [Macrococcus brunensis]ULG72219.1 hypothetical protein MGG12_01440 [Macrococcus brunensis]